MNRRPLEWVKYHMAKMGRLLATRLHMDWPAHGAASILFHEYLVTGEPLPDDDQQLAILAGGDLQSWRTVSDRVRSLFYRKDGKLHQRELDEMLAEAEDYLVMRRNFGRQGGLAKAEGEKVVRMQRRESGAS